MVKLCDCPSELECAWEPGVRGCKASPARIKAKELHEQLLEDNPDYKKQWEHVTAVFRTMLADAEIPDDAA